MQWQSTPYELPVVAAALICACLAAYAWRHRPAPGTRSLAALLVATSVWSLAYALQLASVSLPAKLFWQNVAYIGVECVPIAWIAFALEYAGRGRQLTPRLLRGLAVEPVVVLLVLFAGDPWHWMRTGAHLSSAGAFTILAATNGPLFWLNVAYSYALVLIGTSLLWPLLEGLVHPNPFYRGQAAMLIISIVAPWVANVLSITGMAPIRGLDLTPFAFTIAGAAMGWSVLHYRLLDVIPVARDTLIESMGDAVLVLDTRGRVVDLNPAARALLDRPAAAVIGRPIGELIPQGDANFRADVWRTASLLPAPADPVDSSAGIANTSGHADSGRMELQLRSGPAPRWFDVRISPLRDPSGQLTGHLVVLDDITERMLAQEALRNSEERARMIFEQAPIGMALLDTENCILRVNRALCEMLGYTERELTALTLDALTHPEDAGKISLPRIGPFGAWGAASDAAETTYQVEQRYLKKNRETLWAQLTVTAIHAGGESTYRLAMIENIFERKRAELLEDEKRHMAYELHDGLAQVTAGAHLHLQAFAGRYHPRSPQAREALERAMVLAQRAAREARGVIAGLRPTVVEEVGLATALHMHVEALRAEGWEAIFDERLGSERLPIALETALFRVALEALANVRKHAQSTRVQVAVAREGESVRLEVRDWGQGFDPQLPRRDDRVGHIGMHSMRERIALLGGRLAVESRPGEGTRVIAEAPIPAADDGAVAPSPSDPANVVRLWEHHGGVPGLLSDWPSVAPRATLAGESDVRGEQHG